MGLALWYELGATWSLREVSQPSKVSPVTYRAVFPINVLGEPFFYLGVISSRALLEEDNITRVFSREKLFEDIWETRRK